MDDHLQTTDFSRPPPETSLEKGIAHAIKEGDFSTAEAMSDKLATLEVGLRKLIIRDTLVFIVSQTWPARSSGKLKVTNNYTCFAGISVFHDSAPYFLKCKLKK